MQMGDPVKPIIVYVIAGAAVVALLLNAQSHRYYYVEGGPGDSTVGFVKRFDNWTGAQCFMYPPDLKSC